MVNYVRMILFWLRWEFMSPEKRYAYLWHRTRNELYTPPAGKISYPE